MLEVDLVSRNERWDRALMWISLWKTWESQLGQESFLCPDFEDPLQFLKYKNKYRSLYKYALYIRLAYHSIYSETCNVRPLQWETNLQSGTILKYPSLLFQCICILGQSYITCFTVLYKDCSSKISDTIFFTCIHTWLIFISFQCLLWPLQNVSLLLQFSFPLFVCWQLCYLFPLLPPTVNTLSIFFGVSARRQIHPFKYLKVENGK